MTTTTEALMALADVARNAEAKAQLEHLYGGSKAYAQQCRDEADAHRAALRAAISDAVGGWRPAIVEDPSKLANCQGIPPPCVEFAGNVEAWKEHVLECVRQLCEMNLGTLRLDGCRADIEAFVNAVGAAPPAAAETLRGDA